MEQERQCLICDNKAGCMVEVDIAIGTLRSNEPPICEECYLSEDSEVQAEIKRIEGDASSLPFF